MYVHINRRPGSGPGSVPAVSAEICHMEIDIRLQLILSSVFTAAPAVVLIHVTQTETV